MSKSIKLLRSQIDRIDARILRLLNARARIAMRLGRAKAAAGRDLYDPVREGKILAQAKKKSRGPFPPEGVGSVFREIISATRSLEGAVEVAYLGPEGSNTHLAALKHFGSSARFFHQPSVEDVFNAVEEKRRPFGVVAVENSLEGAVAQTLDLFIESSVTICAEVNMEITHSLLSRERSVDMVRKVYSHPQAIAQCRPWLRRNLPWAALKESESTSSAALRASQEKGSGAIASTMSARLYSLRILAEGIEEKRDNMTRFLVIGRTAPGRTERSKTSLLLSLKDEPGALFRVLKPIARYGVNMTKIESRPLKGKAWEYIFFIDVDGHASEPLLSRALKEVERECLMLKVLGSYPSAELPF